MEDVQKEAFEQIENQELVKRVKVLEYDNAELVKSNVELKERVKKLASRHPQWPPGYRPRKHSDIGPRISK